MRTEASLLLALTLCAVAPAQERRTLGGLVTDREGQPVAVATVTLCAAVSPGNVLLPADLATATTDDKGRFRAEVIDCVAYAAWAVGPARDDGTRLASPVRGGVTPGPRLDLRCEPIPSERPLAVSGLDAWQDLAPFTARLWVREATGFAVDVALDEQGRATMPPAMPHGDLLVELIDKDGQPLFIGTSIPPPVEIPILVRSEAGEPVADAEILQPAGRMHLGRDIFGYSQRFADRVCGRTGADGRTIVRLPLGKDPFTTDGYQNVELTARKAGLADSLSGFLREMFVDSRKAERGADAPRELSFVLHPEQPLKGRILRNATEPMAGIRVAFRTRASVQAENATFHLARLLEAVTEPDGTFTVPHAPLGLDLFHLRIDPAVADPMLHALAPDLRAFVPGQPFLAAVRALTRVIPDIDLSKLLPVQLQVLDAAMGPAAGALAVLTELRAETWYVEEWDPRFSLDPAGRAGVLLPPGKWFLFVTDGRNAAHAVIDPVEDPRPEVRLEPMARLRGTVLDADGKPVAGAQMCWTSYGFGNVPGDLVLRCRTGIAVSVLQYQIRDVRTDAGGRFELRFLGDTSLDCKVRFGHEGRFTADWQLRVEEEPIEVRLQ